MSNERLSASFVMRLNRNGLVSLDPILVLHGARFRQAQVGVLVSTTTMGPVFSSTSVRVRIGLLFARVVNTMIRRAVRFLLFVRTRFHGQVSDVACVANDGHYFKGLRRSNVSRTTISTPVHICVVEVQVVCRERAVFRCVRVAAKRASESFAEAVNADHVRRSVTVTFLFQVEKRFNEVLLYVAVRTDNNGWGGSHTRPILLLVFIRDVGYF